MSKQNVQREQKLLQLGKDLARRAKSCCELCSNNTSLYALEIPPFPEEPTLEHSLFLCDICIQRMNAILPSSQKQKSISKSQKEKQEKLFLSNDLLFLQQKVWSEIPVVQISAIVISHKAMSLGFGWAIEMIDGLFLEEENTKWVQELVPSLRL